MNNKLKEKIISVCQQKIMKSGQNVGLSFYAFFKNKNENPEELLEVAIWWISVKRLNHFEKAVNIVKLVNEEKSN